MIIETLTPVTCGFPGRHLLGLSLRSHACSFVNVILVPTVLPHLEQHAVNIKGSREPDQAFLQLNQHAALSEGSLESPDPLAVITYPYLDNMVLPEAASGWKWRCGDGP